MSKKKFTDGLESLFSTDTSKEVGRRGTSFLNPEKSAGETATIAKKRSSSRKTFTTDLDSLLEEALQESFEEQMARREKEKATTNTKTVKEDHHQNQRRRPTSGLDMLIRRTIETGSVEADRKTGTKRLTVTFDKEKIQKLKKIARLEKAYLKDILGKLVQEYIEEYETEKGEFEE